MELEDDPDVFPAGEIIERVLEVPARQQFDAPVRAGCGGGLARRLDLRDLRRAHEPNGLDRHRRLVTGA